MNTMFFPHSGDIHMKSILLFSLLPVFATLMAQSIPDSIRASIEAGNFTQAQNAMTQLLDSGKLPETQTLALTFEIERLDRIRKDFPHTQTEVLKGLTKYYPGITAADLVKFESDRSLEMKVIDGEKRYFSNAVPNLFRINKEAKKHRDEINGAPANKLTAFLASYLPTVLSGVDKTHERIVLPIDLTLTYTLTVDADAVPDGEIIRCWLPFPRETHERQKNVRLISLSEKNYVIADKSTMQRTVYTEKKARKGEPTVFHMIVGYTSASDYYSVGASKIEQGLVLSADSVKEFTSERPPHIVFTPELQRLSHEIVGSERDPLKKARLIFTWVSDHIPWASAREYSTLSNIPQYCIENKHGDCGIQSLLFITLCRYNGIPAKWQSGWMLHPVEVNLHDWSEIFLDGYGWVPVDQSFGIQPSEDPRVKYYYLGGIDAYRLIVNDDFSRALFPAKIFPRSETVDFQRGEVEWRGGNLYFDKWSYHMHVDYKDHAALGTEPAH
jgi:transglutaminase-like putative cysteine protease